MSDRRSKSIQPVCRRQGQISDEEHSVGLSHSPHPSELLPLMDSASHVSRNNPRRSSFSAADLKHRHSSPPASHSLNLPWLQRLFASQYTVLNPTNHVPSNSSTHHLQETSLDYESYSRDLDDYCRRNLTTVVRPQKLIGHFDYLAVWEDCLAHNLTQYKNKRVRRFYSDQNDLIQRFIDIDHFLDNGKIHLNMLSTYTNSKSADVLLEEDIEPSTLRKTTSKSRFNDLPGNIRDGGQFLGVEEELLSKQVLIAIMLNFFVNFLLLLGKFIISYLTSSLSAVASLVDSVLDFLSTFIIYIANRLSNTKNWQTQNSYPIGRTKLEPLGILIFSIIIIISFFQVGLESFKKLFLNSAEEKVAVAIGWNVVLILLLTIVAKMACWWWCFRSSSSSVQALAQDAVTDIVFNSILLVMPAAGYVLDIWWLDPTGALVLSVYIIISWSITAFEHIDNLTGAVAAPNDYKVVLYLAYRFAESIKKITALKVYHAGDNLIVEIDLVFDTDKFDLSFKDAHDIAEALQYALETLPNVERAFVHIDYMEGNFKGHLT